MILLFIVYKKFYRYLLDYNNYIIKNYLLCLLHYNYYLHSIYSNILNFNFINFDFDVQQ